MEDTEKLQLGIMLMYLNTRGIEQIKGQYHSYNGKIVFEGLNKFYITRYKKHLLQKNIIKFLTELFQKVLSENIKINNVYRYLNGVDKCSGTITLEVPEGTFTISNTITSVIHNQESFNGKLI